MPSQLELELLNRQAYAPKSADEAIQDSVIDFWNKITTPTMPDVDEDLSQVTGGLSGLVADTSPLGLLGMAPMIKGGTGIKGLYSRLNKAVEAMPDKLSVAAAKSWLTQRAGKEEASWRNIEKILGNRNPQDKVTKAELATHLEANPLNVKTTTLGKIDPTFLDPRYSEGGPPITPTKYPKYTLPGGKNYREDLIQLDKKKPNGKPIDFAASPEEVAAQLEMPIVNAHIPDNTYYSSHWNEPNILAHVRHNQRTLPAPERVPKDILSDVDPNEFGSKGRFIEEIQSDWHETGREQGYKTPEMSSDWSRKLDDLKQRRHELAGQVGPFAQGVPPNPVDDEYDEVMRQISEMSQHPIDRMVPDAPFKEDWANLALKQQLMDVVEDPNLEWMGWTPGSVQNDRYDLSNHVSGIAYERNKNTGGGTFFGYDVDGNPVTQQTLKNDDELVALIGKDAASRLIHKGPTTDSKLGFISQDATLGMDTDKFDLYEMFGEDLKVGGQGMTDFYDRQLPEKMNKILKGFGGKVEQVGVPFGKTPQLDITVPRLRYGGSAGGRLPEGYHGEVTLDGDPIASTWPPVPAGPGSIPEVKGQAAELASLIGPRIQPQQVQAWIARLPPEMKERIKKEGLPLLMLLMAREMEGPDGSNQAEELR